MTQKSKLGALGIFLAVLAVIASLVFLWCVLKHDAMGHHGHGYDHDAMHGTGPMVMDAYARANGASAKTGAVFFAIKNHADENNMLIGASSPVAAKAELHTHSEVDGLMQMRQIEGGITLKAHGVAELKRGGDHVMLMGLKQPLNHGDMISITLLFEKSEPITLEVSVDLKRKPGEGAAHTGH